MVTYVYESPAVIESVAGVVAWAETATFAHPELPPPCINVVLVCLQELVGNIALYARRCDGPPIVKVGLRIESHGVALSIEDNGQAFDPVREVPGVLDTDLASAVAGGRGVRIVRELVCSMIYNRVGEWNRVTLEIA